MVDGIELSSDSLNTDVQLLLNMYCNDYMNHDDGTCCATTEPVTYIQLAAFFFLFVWYVISHFSDGFFHFISRSKFTVSVFQPRVRNHSHYQTFIRVHVTFFEFSNRNHSVSEASPDNDVLLFVR